MKKFLIISPTGDESLHHHWLKTNNGILNYDLWCVNFTDINNFGTLSFSDEKTPKCTKMELMNYILFEKLDSLQSYDYIWFPDNDIEIAGDQINSFFNLCLDNKFSLAQPALTLDSYSSFPVTMLHENSLYRRTTFVEIMAPCFSIETLNILRTKKKFNSRAGWGFEPYLMEHINPIQNVFAIVDSTPMKHTRPIIGPYYPWLDGGSAIDEMHRELENHIYINKLMGWFRCNLEITDNFGNKLDHLSENFISVVINSSAKIYRNSRDNVIGNMKIKITELSPNIECKNLNSILGHASYGEYIQMQINVNEYVNYFKSKISLN